MHVLERMYQERSVGVRCKFQSYLIDVGDVEIYSELSELSMSSRRVHIGNYTNDCGEIIICTRRSLWQNASVYNTVLCIYWRVWRLHLIHDGLPVFVFRFVVFLLVQTNSLPIYQFLVLASASLHGPGVIACCDIADPLNCCRQLLCE